MNRSCVSKEAQLQALQNEVGHLKTTINTLNISLKQKSDELKHEWSKVSSLTSQLQEKDNCLQQQIEDLKLERHNASARIKSQLSALQQENISLLRQKQTIEGYLTETRSEVKRMKTELSVKEQYAKRQIETNMNETILENSKLCFKVSELESERKQRDIDHHSKVQKLANDCEIYKHEASLAANESGTIAKKYVILEQAIDELKTKYQETQEELERTSGEVIAQQKKLESVEEKLCDEESEKNIMKMTSCKRIKDQQDAYIASTNEKERLQSELSLMKSKLEVERREMKEVMKGQEKMLKSQINKEKRKAECYKEKAIDAHTKNLHAKHLLRQQEQQRNDLRSP
jgi:chromosome segregation ATPase